MKKLFVVLFMLTLCVSVNVSTAAAETGQYSYQHEGNTYYFSAPYKEYGAITLDSNAPEAVTLKLLMVPDGTTVQGPAGSVGYMYCYSDSAIDFNGAGDTLVSAFEFTRIGQSADPENPLHIGTEYVYRLFPNENANVYNLGTGGFCVCSEENPGISAAPASLISTTQTPSETTPAKDTSFEDVPKSIYCYQAVQGAVEQKITTGTSANKFSPNATCSKGEILTFLWRAVGSPEPSGANTFSDIKTSDYFYKPALWARENGIIAGSEFNAGTPCTRSDVVTYLWNLAQRPDAGSNAFTDVPNDAAYAQAVSWAVEQGITTGTSTTAFSPDMQCSRGQIVTFLYRDMAK